MLEVSPLRVSSLSFAACTTKHITRNFGSAALLDLMLLMTDFLTIMSVSGATTTVNLYWDVCLEVDVSLECKLRHTCYRCA